MKIIFLKLAVVLSIFSSQVQAQALPFKITLSSLNQSTAYCLDQVKFDLLHHVLNSETWYDYSRTAVMEINWMLDDGHMNFETSNIGAWARSKGKQAGVKLMVRQTNNVLDENGNPESTLFLEVNQGEVVSMISLPSVTFSHQGTAEATDRLGRYDTDKIILSQIHLHKPVGYVDRMEIINRNRPTKLTMPVKDYMECMVSEMSSRQL